MDWRQLWVQLVHTVSAVVEICTKFRRLKRLKDYTEQIHISVFFKWKTSPFNTTRSLGFKHWLSRLKLGSHLLLLAVHHDLGLLEAATSPSYLVVKFKRRTLTKPSCLKTRSLKCVIHWDTLYRYTGLVGSIVQSTQSFEHRMGPKTTHSLYHIHTPLQNWPPPQESTGKPHRPPYLLATVDHWAQAPSDVLHFASTMIHHDPPSYTILYHPPLNPFCSPQWAPTFLSKTWISADKFCTSDNHGGARAARPQRCFLSCLSSRHKGGWEDGPDP